jgi:hypothetical protein
MAPARRVERGGPVVLGLLLLGPLGRDRLRAGRLGGRVAHRLPGGRLLGGADDPRTHEHTGDEHNGQVE